MIKNIKVYGLYHRKEVCQISIAPMEIFIDDNKDLNDVRYYNETYFISNNLDKLKERAEQIKAEWIRETEERLETLNAMKISVRKMKTN